MMSSNWNFKALVEPTTKKFRVVFDRGMREMQFFTEGEANTFAAEHNGTVEPIVRRPFQLQRAR
jgi:hypothetical protein